MPMTLYFKRAKAFVLQDADSGTKKFLAQPGPSPQPVPFWVANTATFKQGIKDGSIVNLTPPEQMPGYRYPKQTEAAEAEEASTEITQDTAEAPEPDVEQTEVPKPEFGGQPMTPVQPAVKVGGITASSKKR